MGNSKSTRTGTESSRRRVSACVRHAFAAVKLCFAVWRLLDGFGFHESHDHDHCSSNVELFWLLPVLPCVWSGYNKMPFVPGRVFFGDFFPSHSKALIIP